MRWIVEVDWRALPLMNAGQYPSRPMYRILGSGTFLDLVAQLSRVKWISERLVVVGLSAKFGFEPGRGSFNRRSVGGLEGRKEAKLRKQVGLGV